MTLPGSSSVSSEIDARAVQVALKRGSAAETPSVSDNNAVPEFRTSLRTNRLTGFQMTGIGSALPQRIVTNEELEELYGFEPGWIKRRTGILERRYAAVGEATSDLCVTAGRRAMEAAGVVAEDIDLLIVGTFTPDFTCPSTACIVQDRLGLDAAAFDLQAACSGFMYSLATAAQYIVTGNARKALVIGGDVNSRIVEPSEMKVASLFGDGAGAVVLEAGDDQQGLICYQLGSDGAGGRLLDRKAGGTVSPLTTQAILDGDHYLRMDGRNVFKWAIKVVMDTMQLVTERSGLTIADIDLFVLHQANIRIIDYAMKELGIPAHKVINNVDRVGNTSAASIPLVLDEALQTNRIQPGDNVLMCGFGAGLTWGTGLFRW